LYRVKATYKYIREDADELSFEVGDVINVIEYEDPEDQVRINLFDQLSTVHDNCLFQQEEGWLMGTKDGSPEKGIFPANFTKPL
jgi:amphiphysin